MKEQFLEPYLRKVRISKVLPYLKLYKNCHLLDIGCGWNALLLQELEPYIGFGVGLDYKAPDINVTSKKIKTISACFDKELPFDSEQFDIVTMLAVLEHLSFPELILQDINRILKPGGGLILTVPTKNAKPVLEFLSFQLNIVNPEEIIDHKNYFNKKDLSKVISKVFKIKKYYYFQFGFNSFCFCEKK